MPETEPLKEIARFVEKDFLISDNTSLIPAADLVSLDEFKKFLAEKLKVLLEEKFDTLVNVLYRIDINESKLSKLFSGKNHDAIPSVLADLIIERQLQKIRLRKMYSEGKL